MSEVFDLLVVGGGINGVGIARDAAGRGLSVLLCDKGDIAGATSSASSKLIHGGLRYLEHCNLRLVREGLAEREILLRTAPHLVRPLRLILPHGPGSRPRLLVRAGLFLYDRLGGARTLPGAESLLLGGPPLKAEVRHGFAFTDCRTDDARLAVTVARDAAQRGARIRTRTAVVAARREGGEWRAELREADGAACEVAARILVNAGGPWALDVVARAGLSTEARLRLVKGSHIVVPRLYDGEHGYLLQNDDRRVVFVQPFEGDFTLIGTTELPFAGGSAEPSISTAEIRYLCAAVERWFAAPPAPTDVVWTFAGVRPLYDDGARNPAAVSRESVLELDAEGPPALSVFGGKLTTFRRLAEQVLTRLAPFLPRMGPAWTANAALPGGGRIDAATPARLAQSYGNDAREILAAPPGRDFGCGLSEAELRWLIEREWAQTADDVLWRRTKLGLHFSPAELRAVDAYMREVIPRQPEPARS